MRVAHMALDMIDYTRGLQEWKGHTIEIRVGIYTGDVVAAVVGKKMPHM